MLYEIPFFGTRPVWEAVPAAPIADFPWDADGFRPVSAAKLCGVGRRELRVRMRSYEENPRVTHLEPDAPVYEDSCLEFFVRPAPPRGAAPVEDAGYFNFEMNPAGTLLCMVGSGKRDRRLLRSLGLPPEHLPAAAPFAGADAAGSYWGVELTVPEALFGDFFPFWRGLRPGVRLRGNFYKCGDRCVRPHYGCWSHIRRLEPEYHVPEDFGEFVLR